MDSFVLSQCVPADSSELARVHWAIFSQPPIYRVIYAGVPEDKMLEKYERGFGAGIGGQEHGSSSGREATYIKVTDRASNKIAGYIIWVYMPNGYKVDEDSQANADNMPAGSNLEVVTKFTEVIGSSRGLHLGHRGPHFMIALLGTHPDFERKGVASMLIRYMFERADRDGIPCYVDSSTKAQPLYERHGFVEVNTMEVDLDQFEGGTGLGVQRWYSMMRVPKWAK